MPIPQDFIMELRARSDIVSIIGEYVQLKRASRTSKGLCPFHSEKTPSFNVFPDTASFYCFGCQAGGDVITFIRMIENLDYVEAVKSLAARANMQMPEDGVDDGITLARRRIKEQNREAAHYFYHQLYTPGGRDALEYLHNRGLTDQTIAAFGVGWAPQGWDNLTKHLKSKGFKDDEIILANLGNKNRFDSLNDVFRARIIFPIIDLQGAVAGFGGRTMEKDHGGRKYINTNTTLVYKKSQNLYGLSFATKTKNDTLVVVEGFMDVITMAQAGITNVVASQGTAFTPEQARLISSYAKRVILSQDGDTAGQNAIKRSIPILRETGLEVRVLKIPDNLDPDEYINKFGADRFRLLMEKCGSDIEYTLGDIRAKYDLTEPPGVVSFLQEACGILAALPPIEQDVYAGRLSEELSIEKSAIISQLETAGKKRRNTLRREQLKVLERETSGRGDNLNPQRKDNLRAAKSEDELLSALMTNPDMIKKTREKLPPEDFATNFNRMIYEKILQVYDNHGEVSLSSLNQYLSNDEMGVVSGLINKRAALQTDMGDIDGYINTIRMEKERLKPGDITDKPLDELDLYLKQLKKNKK